MDLASLNPKLHAAQRYVIDNYPDYVETTTKADIKSVEKFIGQELPKDMTSYLLEYGEVTANPDHDVTYFKCDFKSGSIITSSGALVSPASKWKYYTGLNRKAVFRGDTIVNARIPDNTLAFNHSNSTLLMDYRDETFGNILYIRKVKRQDFGTLGYDWDDVGFVAENFTEFLRGLGTKKDLKKQHGLKVKL